MNRTAKVLLTTSALAVLAPFAALAQTASGDEELLGEVVVTATRQADTVSRVPLSVSAVTQRALDQSGVKNVQDLTRSVPSVTFRGTGTQDTSISIRGIISGLGAPTTGVYLDDTPLQKRLANGVNSGNGNAYPQLFDLERVEVLRGPQGTLYGGSSEGGTVRFITPQPSLTRYSTYIRGEVSDTEGGGASYEGGVAVGGPIVQDKLGFRGSVQYRHAGGYIDHVSLYDGGPFGENTNSEMAKTVRLAVAWAVTDRFRITPAYYASTHRINDSDVFWEDVPQYFVRSGTFNNSGTIHSVPYSFPNRPFVGGTQGPFNQFGPFRTPVGYYPTTANPVLQTSPRTTLLSIPTLTLDYDLGPVQAKSITSLVTSRNKGYNSGQFGIRNAVLPTTITGNCGQGTLPLNYAGGCAPIIFPGFPQQYSQFVYRNSNKQLSQEVRFSSQPEGSRLTWVAGAYYAISHFGVNSDQYNNEDEFTIWLRGVPEAYFTGQRALAPFSNFAHREIIIREEEKALFGEANYEVVPRLKATAGVRLSWNDFQYRQTTGGAVFAPEFGFRGTAADPFPTATNGNGGFVTVAGRVKESPITPKLGLSWQATDRNLFYATMAKGYRAGGVNVPANPVQCAAGIAAIGGSPPDTYTSDSVWSYEGGAKVRLFGDRAQVNSSLFYIDWKNPQISQSFPTCGYSYIANAGSAVSKGFDVQAEVRLVRGLTIGGSLAYTDAHYTETIRQPGGTSVVVSDGDELGAPKWQYNVSAQYSFDVFARRAYVRGEYRYQGDYQRGGAFGTTGYDPVTARGEATHYVTARAGVAVGPGEVSVFVNNLTNSRDRIFVGHGSGSPLVTASTFRPREIGLQFTYRN